MADDKIDDEKQNTSSASHFDHHGSASVQYNAHGLIKEVQGFHKSH